MSTSTNYTQGYSASTTASHASRTATTDAAFLLPHLQPHFRVLDVGSGPGTITVGLGNRVPRGAVVGVDVSADLVARASALAAHQRQTGELRQDNVSFAVADLLRGGGLASASAHLDAESFDVVFASQLFPHLPPPGLPEAALAEMRRVLKPGGILATRDAAAFHYFPARLDLDRLLSRNMLRGLGLPELPGPGMPALYRRVGFDVDGDGDGGGKVAVVGAGTTCHASPESRRWWAGSLAGRLAEGDAFRESWVKAGVPEDEIRLCRERLQEWAETPDAWYVCVQTEIVAWK
ncbi:S-adenosyl-L-methionine-dependent methyltransferase [Xylariomycetidae sp. FL2044]|nr:S-adenosyl-L-methionine-dependent methyltransferase [Xylariomycetidae sp. FL2044]